jgi:hypothetical protein
VTALQSLGWSSLFEFCDILRSFVSLDFTSRFLFEDTKSYSLVGFNPYRQNLEGAYLPTLSLYFLLEHESSFSCSGVAEQPQSLFAIPLYESLLLLYSFRI